MRRRFGTYNLMNFDRSADPDRNRTLARVIQQMDVDVLAVQELTAATPEQAQAQLAALAAMTGLTGMLPGPSASAGGPRHAAGAGSNRFAVGLLWRDDPAIVASPDPPRVYAANNFFHSLIKMSFLIDGRQVTCASWHGCPIGRNRRADEAERVCSALVGVGPALLGCDANTIGYARVRDPATGNRVFYDADPYAGLPWQKGFIHTCEWDDEDGVIRAHRADRRAARNLQAGGLHDLAPLHSPAWTATSGHHPNDALGMPRRLAYVFGDDEMAARVDTVQVHDTAESRSASDHLPVTVSWDNSS